VDGKEVPTQKMEDTLSFLLPFVASLGIGSETRTGVNDADSQPPFTFTGKLNKVTLTIDRPKLSPEDIKELEESQRKKKQAIKQPELSPVRF